MLDVLNTKPTEELSKECKETAEVRVYGNKPEHQQDVYVN